MDRSLDRRAAERQTKHKSKSASPAPSLSAASAKNEPWSLADIKMTPADASGSGSNQPALQSSCSHADTTQHHAPGGDSSAPAAQDSVSWSTIASTYAAGNASSQPVLHQPTPLSSNVPPPPGPPPTWMAELKNVAPSEGALPGYTGTPINKLTPKGESGDSAWITHSPVPDITAGVFVTGQTVEGAEIDTCNVNSYSGPSGCDNASLQRRDDPRIPCNATPGINYYIDVSHHALLGRTKAWSIKQPVTYMQVTTRFASSTLGTG